MGAIYQSLIDEIDDSSLVLAVLHAMREESMRRLLSGCVELDPAQREGIIALINGLGTAENISPETEDIPQMPRAASL